MTELTITLPLPDKCMSPNARTHWWPKQKATAKHRNASYISALVALAEVGEKAPQWKSASFQATWFKRTKHKLDQTNATGMLKAAEDGLEDAGIVENDSGVEWAPHEFKVDKADPRIELTIRSLD